MTMNKVHARRLLKLADFLEGLPRERFYYGSWVGRDWRPGKDLHACGTTACALGWATAMPEFRRLGLRLRRTHGGWNHPALANDRGAADLQTERATKKLFGLSKGQHEDLFIFGVRPSGATPSGVANHIRKRVKEWSADSGGTGSEG